MKRYLIACIDTDMTKEDVTPQCMEFSNPVIFTHESNQLTDNIVSKYRLNYRIPQYVPTITIALSDITDNQSANIIVKTLGKKFNYDKLHQFQMFLSVGLGVCIDVFLDNDSHIDSEKIFPNWLCPTKKRVDFFAAKNQ